MNRLKKIFLTVLCTMNFVVFPSDDYGRKNLEKKQKEQQYILEKEQDKKSAAMWAGVAGVVGAVAGTAVGYWLANSDADYQSTYVVINNIEPQFYDPCVCDFLSPKARQIKSQLDGLAQYGQSFDLSDNEHAIISNLYKLGFRLHQIDNTFYSKLAQDYKVLHDAGYSIWWHSLTMLEAQKNCYLSNSKKIINYFNRHEDFIRSHRIINSYEAFPLEPWNMPRIMIYPPQLPSWIRCACSRDNRYPLIVYKSNLESDKQVLVRLQRNSWNLYPMLVEKARVMQRILDYAIMTIEESFEYKQEVDRKRQDELQAEWNRIEQERLDIARKQARALEEANRLAAERNRIERERDQYYRDDRW